MRWLFIAAWVAGVAATVADLDAILLPAGGVVAAFGAGALRRDAPGGLLARAAGVDVRAIVRAFLDGVLGGALHGTRRRRPPTPLNSPASSAPTPARSRPTSPNNDRSIYEGATPTAPHHYPGGCRLSAWVATIDACRTRSSG